LDQARASSINRVLVPIGCLLNGKGAPIQERHFVVDLVKFGLTVDLVTDTPFSQKIRTGEKTVSCPFSA
jgi:hypothetical protein